MFPGIDPTRLAAVQQSTKDITGVIIVDYKVNSVLLELSPHSERASEAMSGLLESFSRTLAQQLESFFAIRGKIIERNK